MNPFDDFGAHTPSVPVATAGTGAWAGPALNGAWATTPAPARHDEDYDLDTTYVPPSNVPSWADPPSQGAWINPGSSASTFLLPATAVHSDATVPAVTPIVPAQLLFTDSTAAPVAKGNIGSMPGTGGPSGRDDGGFGSQPAATASTSRPLLGPETTRSTPTAEDTSKYAFYNIRRYRPYFDVDTQEVLWRVMSSFIGAFKPDFMEVTHAQPDLYGPFWVATTLIFITAAAGNLSSYIAWKEHDGGASPSQSPAPPDASSGSPVVIGQWYADTTKLGTSAAIFYGYTFIISLLLWFGIKYLKGDIKLVNMYCIYGYALTIFIPTSILCVVPLEAVRWVVVVVATLLSGGFLFMNMKRTVVEVPVSQSMWLLGAVGLLHAGLGVTLKLFFFNY